MGLIAIVLAGCGTTINTLRVPLHEGPQPQSAPASSLDITDRRAAADRMTHTGKLFSCQRWYGDDTFMPSKLEYLKHLLSARLASRDTLQLGLERFDIIESCEDTANRAGAAAATGASYGAGNPVVYTATGVPGGDSVLVRIAGRFEGSEPFDISRRFDYSDLTWKFTEMPAENPEYRNRLRKALDEIADEIVSRRKRLPGL